MKGVTNLIIWTLSIAGAALLFIVFISMAQNNAKEAKALAISEAFAERDLQIFELKCSEVSSERTLGWVGTAVYDRGYAVFTYRYCVSKVDGQVTIVHSELIKRVNKEK